MSKLRSRPTRLTIALLALVFWAAPATACPVCGANRPKDRPSNNWPVLVSTGAMLTLPLGMAAGLYFWLRKRL